MNGTLLVCPFDFLNSIMRLQVSFVLVQMFVGRKSVSLIQSIGLTNVPLLISRISGHIMGVYNNPSLVCKRYNMRVNNCYSLYRLVSLTAS